MAIYEITKKYVHEYSQLRPIIATIWGLNEYDNEWGDFTVESYDKEKQLLSRYQKIIPSKTGEFWNDLAIYHLEDDISFKLESIQRQDYYYDLNSIDSTFQNLVYTFDNMRRESQDDWRKIVNRLKTFDIAFDQYISRLKKAVSEKKTVAKRQVLAVIKQAEDLKTSFGTDLKQNRKFVSEDELNSLLDKKKMYEKFILFLTQEYLPFAQEKDPVGLQRYEWGVRKFIGNKIDLEKSYMWGFEEINRLINEMNKLCIDTNCKSYLELTEKAKNDKQFIIDTPEKFLKWVEEKEAFAMSRVSHLFDIPDVLKQLDVKKLSINTVIAQYVSPSPDFKRAGCISYGFEKGKPIPLYDQLSTAYHEGFPGHHLQCGLQVYMPKLSLLGKLVSFSGYAEGWALYAEKLMQDNNGYPNSYYVLGTYAMSLFRACRVVIDIGIHLEKKIPDDFFFNPGKTWNFELGKKMMVDVVGLSNAGATDEVNRYCGWPGQAISYKLGEKAILDLKTKYIKAGYSLKEFHMSLLRYGSVGLGFMTESMEAELKIKTGNGKITKYPIRYE